jgi:predicted ribonuclease YlaK
MNLMRENIYVLDTCVLLNDPEIIGKLGHGQIIIPTAVIRELDCLKRNPDPKEPRSMAARKVARTLDTLGSSQNIASGAKTSMGATVRIINQFVPIDDLANNADNRIIGTALKMKEDTQGRVILVSDDGNMRNVTRSYGIEATGYPLHQKNRPFLNNRLTPNGRAYRNIIVAAAVMILLVLFLK